MNKLQKRELRKKRHSRQQYLKHEAPLDRLEEALHRRPGLRCPSRSKSDGLQCIHDEFHTGYCFDGLGNTWPCNTVNIPQGGW